MASTDMSLPQTGHSVSPSEAPAVDPLLCKPPCGPPLVPDEAALVSAWLVLACLAGCCFFSDFFLLKFCSLPTSCCKLACPRSILIWQASNACQTHREDCHHGHESLPTICSAVCGEMSQSSTSASLANTHPQGLALQNITEQEEGTQSYGINLTQAMLAQLVLHCRVALEDQKATDRKRPALGLLFFYPRGAATLVSREQPCCT